MTAPSMRPPTPFRRISRAAGTVLLTLGAMLLWWVIVCYDLRAWVIGPSLWRYVRFPVEPAIAADWPGEFPAPPAELEVEVRRRIPWTRDFDVYHLPWYVTTPREALRQGRGDCEAQAFVLASLLAAQGTPYSFRASFSHLWVDYPGRRQQRGERDAEAVWSNIDGHYRLRLPTERVRETIAAQKGLLWDPLHPLRKALLLAGWPALIIAVPRRRARLGRNPVEQPVGL